MSDNKKEVSLYCNQSSVQTQMIYKRTVVNLSSKNLFFRQSVPLKIDQI